MLARWLEPGPGGWRAGGCGKSGPRRPRPAAAPACPSASGPRGLVALGRALGGSHWLCSRCPGAALAVPVPPLSQPLPPCLARLRCSRRGPPRRAARPGLRDSSRRVCVRPQWPAAHVCAMKFSYKPPRVKFPERGSLWKDPRRGGRCAPQVCPSPSFPPLLACKTNKILKLVLAHRGPKNATTPAPSRLAGLT